MNKILVEYNLEELSYNQLRSMLLFLKQSNQNENIKAVNVQLMRLDSIIGMSTEPYKFPEMEPNKTFWQKLFGK